MSTAYLDYYGENCIIPVHQDISNLKVHFLRREGLYRTLGIAPGLMNGKRVAELGPGTGDNATYPSSLGLAEYVLVDGNPASIEAIKEKVATGVLPQDITVIHENILNYENDGHFDVVICEGVVPHTDNPPEFLRHVSRLAKPAGIMAVTTASATSLLPELCRRLFRPFAARKYSLFSDQLAYLTEFYREDLLSLESMSRRHEDWVLDNILHPWTNGIFTIPEAIAAISDNFDFHSSSPSFFQDWRWYKKIGEPDFGFNALATRQYWSYSAAFMDYRAAPHSAMDIDGEALENLCRRANDQHAKAWNGDDNAAQEFLATVDGVANLIDKAMPETGTSLRSFIAGYKEMAAGKEPKSLKDFRPLFGQGQQYASFIRRD